MILSVDRIQLLTGKKEIYYPGLMVPFAAFDLKMRPVLRAYIPSRVMPVVTISKVDSLLWDLNPTLSDHDVGERSLSAHRFYTRKSTGASLEECGAHLF